MDLSKKNEWRRRARLAFAGIPGVLPCPLPYECFFALTLLEEEHWDRVAMAAKAGEELAHSKKPVPQHFFDSSSLSPEVAARRAFRVNTARKESAVGMR